MNTHADSPEVLWGVEAKTFLVTGGTGFIGQRLIAQLLTAGHRVTLLTRDPVAALGLFTRPVQAVRNLAELPPTSRFDVVINLAGARILGWRWSAKRKAVLYRSRVSLTEQLVAWLDTLEQKPGLLLSASAIGYYGIQPQGDDTELSESAPPQPLFMSELCQAWEAAAQRALAQHIPVVVMRFGLVLGAGGALPLMLLPIKMGLAGPLAGGRQWISWIHLEDLLQALAFVCRRHLYQDPLQPRLTVYNFTAPQAVSQLQFHQTAAALLKRPCTIPTPGWPMRLLLGEQADLLLKGQRVYPHALLAAGFRFQFVELRQALAALLLSR